MSSEEYRLGIRTIAACVAKLSVELVLIDFSKIDILAMEDQHFTAAFLQQTLQDTTIRRSARVLPTNNSLWFAYRLIMEEIKELPYQAKAFISESSAVAWLLEEKESLPYDLISVPFEGDKLVVTGMLNTLAEDKEDVTTSATAASEASNLYRTDYVEIALNKQKDVLLVRWLRPMQSAEYRHGIEEAGRFLLAHNLEKLLVNNVHLGALSMSDQNWLAKISMEVISKSRLKRLAIISTHDINQLIADEALDHKVKSTANLTFDTRYFFSEDEALEWLALPEEATELRWQQQFPQPNVTKKPL